MIPKILRLLGASLLLWLSPGKADDLLLHCRTALESNPQLRAADAMHAAMGARVSQARAGFLPTLTATGSANRNDQEVMTDNVIFSRPAGQATYSSTEYRLNLSQPVYNAALLAQWRVAEADRVHAEAAYAYARQELLVKVAQAYFEVLLAEETLALTRAEKETLTRQLESARGRLGAGLVPITAVHDTEARFQSVVAQEIEVQHQLEDKREALRQLSSLSPGDLARLGEEMPLVLPEPPDVARWTETALRQNFSLQAAKASAEVARGNIAQSRAGHHPSLEIVGNRTRSDADASITGPGVRSDETVIGLQLTVPLFQGGLVHARTREAMHRHEAAQQEFETRRRAVERTARSAFQGVAGTAAKIEALKRTVSSASSSVSAKTEGYRAGLYTTVDVLDATRDLYRARRDLAEARHGYVLNLLQLKLAAGTLSEDDIAAVNGWLR